MQNTKKPPQIVLASSSPYRQQILSTANIPFIAKSPNIDETPLRDENASELVMRLALSKAKALAEDFPEAYIIGSDQVLALHNEILGKPMNHENALTQLMKCSGKVATLHTGIAVFHAKSGQQYCDIDYYRVHYRHFSRSQAQNYLHQEQPYDCCGSLKAEGAGIVLLKKLSGNDPNTLLGLPLLKLIDYFEAKNIITFF